MGQTVVPLRRMPFPSAEEVKKGLYGFKDVTPDNALESHQVLWTMAHLLAYHTRCVIDVTDTFVALNADTRIIVPMVSAADLVGSAASAGFKAEKEFRELYGAEIAQFKGNVQQMQYPANQRRRAS